MRTTRWSPDTCQCVLEYEWDETVPQEDRVHTFKGIVHRCLIHELLGYLENSNLYDKVLQENTRKNGVFGDMEIQIKAFGHTFTMDNFRWQFDQDRKLQIEIVDVELTQQQRTNIQTFLDNKFGTGEVTLI